MRFSRRSTYLIAALFCVLFVAAVYGRSYALDARVKYVIDGDTIVLTSGVKVRYMGINAPEVPHKDEKGEPLGIEARKRNKRLVQGKFVHLEYGAEKKDRFGRRLAFVFLRDGRMVNEILVREGLAFVCMFNKRMKYRQRLLNAQKDAIKRKVGLWALSPTRPEPFYIGNKRTLRFHRPGCPYGRKTWAGNRVIFKEPKDAYLKGYCRCKKCLPFP